MGVRGPQRQIQESTIQNLDVIIFCCECQNTHPTLLTVEMWASHQRGNATGTAADRQAPLRLFSNHKNNGLDSFLRWMPAGALPWPHFCVAENGLCFWASRNIPVQGA